MHKGIKQYYSTNKRIPKELIVENLAYLSTVCHVSLNELWKLVKWRPKEEVAGLKKTICKFMNRKKSSKDLTHRTWEQFLDLQLIHLLFTEASSEIVSMEGWLSRSHSEGSWGMPNDTRSGLKISGSWSYGEMNPPQSPADQHPKKSFGMSWRTITEDYLKNDRKLV